MPEGRSDRSSFADRITVWECDTIASHDHVERGCKGATYLREGLLSDGTLAAARVLVGDSVFEDAQVSIRDGWLHIEFEGDLDSIALELAPLARSDEHTPRGFCD